MLDYLNQIAKMEDGIMSAQLVLNRISQSEAE